MLTERLELCMLREMLARGDHHRALLYADDFPHLRSHLPEHVTRGMEVKTLGP